MYRRESLQAIRAKVLVAEHISHDSITITSLDDLVFLLDVWSINESKPTHLSVAFDFAFV